MAPKLSLISEVSATHWALQGPPFIRGVIFFLPLYRLAAAGAKYPINVLGLGKLHRLTPFLDIGPALADRALRWAASWAVVDGTSGVTASTGHSGHPQPHIHDSVVLGGVVAVRESSDPMTGGALGSIPLFGRRLGRHANHFDAITPTAWAGLRQDSS